MQKQQPDRSSTRGSIQRLRKIQVRLGRMRERLEKMRAWAKGRTKGLKGKATRLQRIMAEYAKDGAVSRAAQLMKAS
jgi:hypothetical protein